MKTDVDGARPAFLVLGGAVGHLEVLSGPRPSIVDIADMKKEFLATFVGTDEPKTSVVIPVNDDALLLVGHNHRPFFRQLDANSANWPLAATLLAFTGLR